ncbi:hypothetical protein HRbin30_00664 [bacterium HR30]|nr:hypothetical protein HRbin30_00664 [bacterium HR30]
MRLAPREGSPKVFDPRGRWVYWDIEQRGPCTLEGRFAVTGEPALRLGRLMLTVNPNGVVSGVLTKADGAEAGRLWGRASRPQLRGYLKFTNSPRARTNWYGGCPRGS